MEKVKFQHPTTKAETTGEIQSYITVGAQNEPRAVVMSEDGELFTMQLSEVWTDKRLAAEERNNAASAKAKKEQEQAQKDDDAKAAAQKAAIEAEEKRVQELADFQKQNQEDPNTPEGERALKERGTFEKAKEVRKALEGKSDASTDEALSDSAPAKTSKASKNKNVSESQDS